ncbi:MULTISPECIES: carbohydrate kinase family protein [Clostridium]|uniref:carbohydrate kinase family protein n=1 Tax=Clostridium TaxID=1485 RepID=UPI001D5CB8A1|nr:MULTISPECIES: carbohydrate kinase family protein [Clostridium]MBS5306336.1 carbohydrate kinase family protein [Clostridium sp.]MDB1943875.1 carbohydrate kinase family protein [Clostridium tertium]MDB1950959.1 carbohydrate kinase family protein [Clostridium tertium]MDU1566492.1 carbohydrate kinase family protein [Clostridium sp.]MDU3523950.1 carbohydrate kinase family protein [Clostridium sp.]
MCNNNPYILVLGASIVDIIGFSRKKYHERDSIPGNIKISLGGVCRNIAENLARVNVNTEFISILGGDDQGRNILENSKLIGYNMEHSLILEDEYTPTYMAILNEHGEMESAIVDMDSLDKMESSFIDSKSHIIENAEYTILDSDNPELLEYILTTFKGKTKFVLDPVSATKAEKIKHLIKYFHTVKPNRLETEVLCGFKIENDDDLKRAGDYFLSLGVKNVFISLDADGIYYKNSKEEGKISTSSVEVKNVTGAGDSFVAGVGYGYMNNLSIKDTVKYAIAMSIVTITHEETINPSMSEDFVNEFIKNMEWIEG